MVAAQDDKIVGHLQYIQPAGIRQEAAGPDLLEACNSETREAAVGWIAQIRYAFYSEFGVVVFGPENVVERI